MDAIRKKMQSLKGETDVLMATISRFEGDTKESNAQSDGYEADIRDLGKKKSKAMSVILMRPLTNLTKL